MPSLSGAFPEARMSQALLSSSRVGSSSNSCMVDMPSMASKANAETVFILESVELGNVLHPYVHLIALVCDHCHAGSLEGSCFALGWSQLMPSLCPHTPP